VGEIERRQRIDGLEPDMRATIAHNLAIEWAEGATYKALAEKYGISTYGVKTLLQEHASYIRNARPDTRSLQEEEYRRFYGEMKGIKPDDPNMPVLVKAKAIEARIQILTRLDKLLGHEIQGDIDGAVNTVAEMVRQMNQRGDFDGISATDLANLEEDIIDVEPEEEDDDE
jgi:hypothetical protein